MRPSIRRQTIADALRRTALRLPAKTAIVCGDTSWTFAEFDALVNKARSAVDDKLRSDLYTQAQDMMQREVPAIIPV